MTDAFDSALRVRRDPRAWVIVTDEPLRQARRVNILSETRQLENDGERGGAGRQCLRAPDRNVIVPSASVMGNNIPSEPGSLTLTLRPGFPGGSGP